VRTAFIQTLYELAEEDDRIWLLCGDLGFSVLEPFRERYPERFVNAGVAEQNLTGLAAGLAHSGKIVFTYSIANFPVIRCLEQIRVDVCYHRANVKIVAVGGGFAYGPQGYTHHGVEDLAIMRAMPHMTVVAPGDPVETRLATRAIAHRPGPCYLRLGKANEPVVHSRGEPPGFEIGRVIRVREGEHLTLISTGAMLELAVQTAQKLGHRGYSTEVLSMPTVQPLDEGAVLQAARNTGKIVTLEEHGPGGLGSAVAETLAIAGQEANFLPLRLPAEPVGYSGSQASLRNAFGLSLDGVVDACMGLLEGKR
jgi:transketolase